jgi:hypothetical protein
MELKRQRAQPLIKSAYRKLRYFDWLGKRTVSLQVTPARWVSASFAVNGESRQVGIGPRQHVSEEKPGTETARGWRTTRN